MNTAKNPKRGRPPKITVAAIDLAARMLTDGAKKHQVKTALREQLGPTSTKTLERIIGKARTVSGVPRKVDVTAAVLTEIEGTVCRLAADRGIDWAPTPAGPDRRLAGLRNILTSLVPNADAGVMPGLIGIGTTNSFSTPTAGRAGKDQS